MKQEFKKRVSGLAIKAQLRNYALLTLGSIVLAVNADLFLIPHNITPGGVLSISIIINSFTGWPIGTMMLIVNIPLMILGFMYLGRFRFLVRTVYALIIYSLGVDLLAQWLPPDGITNNLLLNSLYGGVVGGIGSGFIFRGRGTVAGTSVIGRIIQIKTGIPISQIYVVTDGIIILTAGLIFGWETALFALMTLFIWGLATDYVLEGPSVIRTAFIVTDFPREVAYVLHSRLGLGVTAWPGTGMYTEMEHAVLFCTVSRPDVGILRTVVAETDPEAFIVIGQGHQANGGILRGVKQG